MLRKEINHMFKKTHDIPSPVRIRANKLNKNGGKDNLEEISISVSDISDTPTDVKIQKKITYGNIPEALLNFLYDYCNQSSIHGFRYISDTKRPFWDRGIWMTLLIISMYGSYTLIHNLWLKWQLSPVIVSFDEKSTPIWQIPFPAVTICPETKTETSILNFTDSYTNLLNTIKKNGYFDRWENATDEEFNNMVAILQICESYLLESFKFEKAFEIESLENTIENIAPEFNLSFPFCKWRNVVSTCEGHFSKTVTGEGICYTFNGLDPTDIYRNTTVQYSRSTDPRGPQPSMWTLEDGYPNDRENITYPQRVLAAGARGGFFIALQGFEQNLDYYCRGPIQGFKVLLHSPDDVPRVSKHYIRVPYEQEVIVSVKPNMLKTSENLVHYDSHKRQCFFSHERQLKYFKVYTQNNCNLECQTNYTLKKCGCVKFSMPRTPDTPVCDISMINCYDDAEDSLLRDEFEQGVKNEGDWIECDCLPGCTSLSYNAEMSQAYFDLENMVKAYRSDYLDENPGGKMSRLSIFFKEHQFITSKRSELYGMTDFFANCGGLLGLFMGVSVLSMFELMYFLTVRLVTCINRRRRKHQANNVVLINLGRTLSP